MKFNSIISKIVAVIRIVSKNKCTKCSGKFNHSWNKIFRWLFTAIAIGSLKWNLKLQQIFNEYSSRMKITLQQNLMNHNLKLTKLQSQWNILLSNEGHKWPERRRMVVYTQRNLSEDISNINELNLKERRVCNSLHCLVGVNIFFHWAVFMLKW